MAQPLGGPKETMPSISTTPKFVALGTTSALPLSPKHASLVESPAQVMAGASKPWYFGAQSGSLTMGTFVPRSECGSVPTAVVPHPVTFALVPGVASSQLGRETGTIGWICDEKVSLPLSVRIAASWLK